MKLKIDWKALGKALWNAVKPVLLGAIGGGVIALTDGCSSLTPSSRGPRRTRTPPAATTMRRRR